MATESVRRLVPEIAETAAVRPQTIDGEGSAVTPHTLRHGVASRMLHAEDGSTLYDVRNRPRHATTTTTEERYDHFDRI